MAFRELLQKSNISLKTQAAEIQPNSACRTPVQIGDDDGSFRVAPVFLSCRDSFQLRG